MVRVTIQNDKAIFDVQGLDKLWSLKSRLEIPLDHIESVLIDPRAAGNWRKGFHAPGTRIPGIITAGTFYQHGSRIFWDVHHPENTIVINLSHDEYDQLIIEVENPQETQRMLQQALNDFRSA